MNPSQRQPREILFEFHHVGNVVKVSAIDPATGIEVAIVGDPRQGEEILKRIAIRKLMYVMNKARGDKT